MFIIIVIVMRGSFGTQGESNMRTHSSGTGLCDYRREKTHDCDVEKNTFQTYFGNSLTTRYPPNTIESIRNPF